MALAQPVNTARLPLTALVELAHDPSNSIMAAESSVEMRLVNALSRMNKALDSVKILLITSSASAVFRWAVWGDNQK